MLECWSVGVIASLFGECLNASRTDAFLLRRMLPFCVRFGWNEQNTLLLFSCPLE